MLPVILVRSVMYMGRNRSARTTLRNSIRFCACSTASLYFKALCERSATLMQPERRSMERRRTIQGGGDHLQDGMGFSFRRSDVILSRGAISEYFSGPGLLLW